MGHPAPGPYSCAEWEMGGLPWWLLKRDGIQLRTTDPKFMEPATRYLKEVGRVLAPLQITHGGPILMVQVENEYGSYGKDAAYMGALRQTMVGAGFDRAAVLLQPQSDIGNGFGTTSSRWSTSATGRRQSFDRVATSTRRPARLMNGEFYPGWFDSWAVPPTTWATTERCLERSEVYARSPVLVLHLHGARRDELRPVELEQTRPTGRRRAATTTTRPSARRAGPPRSLTEDRGRCSPSICNRGETLPQPPATRDPVIAVPEFRSPALCPVRGSRQQRRPGVPNRPEKLPGEKRVNSFDGKLNMEERSTRDGAASCTPRSLPPGPAGKLTVGRHARFWLGQPGRG